MPRTRFISYSRAVSLIGAFLCILLVAPGVSGASQGAFAQSSSSGPPIKLMGLMTTQSSVVSYGNGGSAMQAAADAINAAGGINGRKIEFSVCNDQLDPNIAAQCAKSAATNGDVGVLGVSHASGKPGHEHLG